MADDINKKITIDVQVNTNAQEQTSLFDSLRTAVGSIGKAAAAAQKEVSATKAQIAAPPSENPFKNFFSNILGYYKKSQQNIQDSEKKSQESMGADKVKTAQTTDAQVVASAKSAQDKIRSSAIDSTQKMAESVFTIMTKSNDAVRDRAILKDEKARKADLAADGDNKAAIAATNQKYDTLENDAKKKAFKADQKVARAQAIINGAIAITKAEAELGPIAGTIALGAIVAQTAAQLAVISKQQPPALAKGGYFQSDGKGAVLPGYSRTDNTNAFLRSGEGVIVSEAMRDPWARNLVSAINVAFGGRDFSVPNPARGYAVGGVFSDGGNANRYYNQPMNDQKNLANTIAYQMINNFPPVYVDVKDINNQQNILAQTTNRVNL
ncbi:MAG: hypothetical protein ACXVJB_09750 [Mucilaginibacter sp.]